MRAFGLTVWAALALAGCGSTETISAGNDFRDRIDANADLASEVAGLPTATAAEVPVTGSATYDGYATVVIDTDVAETSLVGDATLVADFAGDTIEGTLDDFVGTVDGGAIRDYDDSLAVSDGDLRVATAAGFGADVNGVLEGGGDTIGVDGSIFGNLRSSPTRDVAALSAISAGGTDFTVNGTEYGGLLTIVAER